MALVPGGWVRRIGGAHQVEAGLHLAVVGHAKVGTVSHAMWTLAIVVVIVVFGLFAVGFLTLAALDSLGRGLADDEQAQDNDDECLGHLDLEVQCKKMERLLSLTDSVTR